MTKIEEEKPIWNVLDLLMDAEYALQAIALRTDDVNIYYKFAKAMEGIRGIRDSLTPIRERAKAEKLI